MAQATSTGNARREIQAALIAILASIAIGSVMILVCKQAPGRVWWLMLEKTFGSRYGFGGVLYRATTLMLTGLSVSIALDAGLFNIGGEGQLTAGLVACAVAGAALPAGTPAIVAVSTCMLAAAAAGGAIGAAIGALRAWRGAHEVITSIMLNAIVGGVVLWIGNTWLFTGGITRSHEIIAGAQLPDLGLAGSPANVATLAALALAAVVWWLRARSTWGTALRAVGANPDAARSVGISVRRVQLLAMTAAGALAGLGAMNLVMGHEHAYENDLSGGAGFLGISAALLGRTHPAGIVLASLFLGFLGTGGLAVNQLVPKELTEMLQGVVVLAVAGAAAWIARQPAAASTGGKRG
jgi:ABC-type uncharacterized transport system permease subunit